MAFRKMIFCAGISTLAFSTAAYAQEEPAAPAAGEVATDSADTTGDEDPTVVITGSRIITTGNNLPTPVTVVNPDTLLKTTPTNIPDGLKKLPIFALSRGTTNLNNSTDNFTGNYLNLRGFGIQRNLVLLDGHRVSPTSYTGAVDTNTLPQMLLQRVDVVTGGASAVYGSDAVSGVINFILDKEFTGIKVVANSGISSRGDAFSWRAGAAFGTDLFGGAGHFEASYEHFRQDPLDDKFDRKNGRKVYAVVGTGSSADPFRLVQDARNPVFSVRGNILSGPLAGQAFVAPGVTGPFDHGPPIGNGLEAGGEGFYGAGSGLTAALTTDQAYGRFDYDISDTMNFFVQGSYARTRNSNNFYPSIIFPKVIAPDNAFLSPATQAALTDPFVFARMWVDKEHTYTLDSKTENWSVGTGINGELGNFRWNVFYQHGVTTTYNTDRNQDMEGNYAAALDAVDEGQYNTGTPNGNIVCRVTLTNPGVYPGCVALNPFGTDPRSQDAALDYVRGSIWNRPKFTLDDIEASISGPIFDNWAGPVSIALSGEYRWLSLDVASSAPANLVADCTGLRFNCTQGVTPVFRGGQITPISVNDRIGEAAIELDFPLLRDVAFAQSLSLNAAARYTNYDTSGSVETWKVGFDWQVIDGLRFRGTRSRDIRAPSLYELFQPATFAQTGYSDLHTGVGGVIAMETAGNANLVPEVAKTLTVGAVFSPSGIPNLSFAIDYYKIKIGNAIATIDGRDAAIQQVCEDSGGTSSFCDLYERPFPFENDTPANAATLVRIQALNAAKVKTWGIDGEVNYHFAVGGTGRISMRGLVSYQPQLTTILAPGLEPLKASGVAATQGVGGVAKWRLTGFLTYATDDFAIDVLERWRSGYEWNANRDLVFDMDDVPSVAYTDVTFTFNIAKNKDRQLFLSVQNLFDKDPPVFLTAGTSGTPAFSFPAAAGDDVIGRYFTFGGRFKF